MKNFKLAWDRMKRLNAGIVLLDFLFAIGLALLHSDPGIAIWFTFPIILFGNFIGCWISVKRGNDNYG